MNREDFEDFRENTNGPMIRARTFLSKGDARMGTLLYGWESATETTPATAFHVYLKDGLIHRLLYREWTHHIEVVQYDYFRAWDANRLVPLKRVYPESITLLMARLLKDAGVEIPFTSFSDSRYERVRDETFHALTWEEIPG